MKYIIFGAGGRVGQNIVLQALDNGHEVVAFVRDADAILLRNPQLSVATGDALSNEDVDRVVAGGDVVISALGSRVIDKPISIMSEAMRRIITAMQKHSVRRVLAVGGAGILQHNTDTLRKDLPDFPAELLHVSDDHYRVYQQLLHSGLEWTIACPAWMPSDDATSTYRTKADYFPEGAEKISAADCAHFLVNEAEKKEFVGHRVGVGY